MQAPIARRGNVIECPIFRQLQLLRTLPSCSRRRKSIARDIGILRRWLQARAAAASSSVSSA